ncbi:hypothetical protein INR49_019515 [Caranx melampygus]|nr:hypothetical protein INR49_019515 [Caranx melampygus]
MSNFQRNKTSWSLSSSTVLPCASFITCYNISFCIVVLLLPYMHIAVHGNVSERQDNEIAQEIQEQLVRQAEQQRQQEEKDAAIARKLQEKEMKEERRRQKQLEANFEEEYYEDHGDYSSTEPKRSRYPRQDPAAPHSRSKYPEHYLVGEGGRSRHADPYPEHLLPSRGKHGDRYPEYEPTETGRAAGLGGVDTERVVRRKERPARPPPPHYPIERDKARDRERDRQRDWDRRRDLEWERHMGKDQRRDRGQDVRGARAGGRDGERSRDRGHTGDRHRERDRQRQKDKDRSQARTRSWERGLDEDYLESGHGRDWSREGKSSWGEEEDDGERERRARGRQLVHSAYDDVFDEPRNDEGRGELWDPQQGEGLCREHIHTQPNGETGTTLSLPLGSAGMFVWCAGVAFRCGNLRVVPWIYCLAKILAFTKGCTAELVLSQRCEGQERKHSGRIVHRGSGTVVAETEYGLSEATKGLTKLDIREQELKDMEVARKLQEEEIKASKGHVRAAQVAQDEVSGR